MIHPVELDLLIGLDEELFKFPLMLQLPAVELLLGDGIWLDVLPFEFGISVEFWLCESL